MKIKQTDIIVIAGQRGTGKTTLAKFIAKKFLENNYSIFVYDPLNEYHPYQRYIPHNPLDTEEFDRICYKIWQLGKIFFIVDEAEIYIQEKKPLPLYFSQLLLRGRHRQTGLCLITRRIALLNKNAFSLSNHIFLFKLFSPNDIKYVSEFIPKDIAIKLPSLKDFHFIYYSNGLSKICSPITPP